MGWELFLMPVLQIVAPILATVLTGVASWALYKYTGIKLDQNQQAQAKQIVLGIEEKAISLCKKGFKAPAGEEKHAEAVVQMQTVTGISQEAAVSQVDRAVGSLPNVGAMQTPCDPMNTP